MMYKVFCRLLGGPQFRLVSVSTKRCCYYRPLSKQSGGKFFFESENTSSHKLLESRPQYSATIARTLEPPKKVGLTAEESKQCWAELSMEEACDRFRSLSYKAAEGYMGPLSEETHSEMCHVLANASTNLSDNRLAEMLMCLRLWPICETVKSPNFLELWKSIDGVCLARRSSWPNQRILYFIDLWFHLKLTRMSDFVYHSIRQLCKKPSRLSPSELVQVMFYLNALRTAHRGINTYELEARLEECLDQLSVEELGVAALGFFKTQTPIHGEKLQVELVQRLTKEAYTVPEITLAAIVKLLRMSLTIPVWDLSVGLLDVLSHQLERLSVQACAHVGLLSARIQTLHPELLYGISNKLVVSIEEARLKDIEKVLFPLTMFNHDPKTSPCIFEEVAKQLDNPRREKEFELYPKCLVAIVHYLALRSNFHHPSIAKILSMDFIRNTYGKTNFVIGREILSIDTCVGFECPDYSGPRLPEYIRNYLSKRYSTYLPNQDRKLSKHGAFVLDVMNSMEILLGEAYWSCKYILPNNSRADMVFGLGAEGNVVPIPEDYRNRPDFTGELRAPSNDGSWRALILSTKNMMIRNRHQVPNGETSTKLRHLRLLGYTPIILTLEDWPSFQGQHQKVEHLKRIIFK